MSTFCNTVSVNPIQSTISDKLDTYKNIQVNESDFDHVESINRPVIHYIIEPANTTIDKAKRVIAMAINYNKDTGRVYYGACIFRREYNNEICTKKLIRKTAEGRFKVSPHLIMIKPNKDIKVKDIAKIIRSSIIINGRENISGDRRKNLNNSKEYLYDNSEEESNNN
jgi:hypothetical protein